MTRAYTTRGLKRGSLPFQMACLGVGESLLVESATRALMNKVIDKASRANLTETIVHMRWSFTRLLAIDLTNPSHETFIVRITRLSDSPSTHSEGTP